MPRYCAAICCKNRRGRNNKDRKLSFYPFPLHDKERLEKWLKNMKRDSWVPSKYQFLCSDHFTPDSLDIRWGIRYLKQTAIPTIFSLPEDDQSAEAHFWVPPQKYISEEPFNEEESQESSPSHTKDIPRGVEFEETERRKVLSAGCGREMRKCVTAAEFRFEMMKNF
uniref:THAP domain-containing protein 5 n=1 Tax=Rousettus aegyptiacus TaxID=9407 RepID=A0A7J8D8W5_ROUAE|nr:THAP domain containing 5 [Rousettus aegyptiacus]